jgi:hypothetical protein
MAARDPETGQYVAGPGGRDGTWSQLDTEIVRGTALINASELDGDTSTSGEDGQASLNTQSEPLGGLGRDTVAELVWGSYELSVVPQSTQTSDGTLYVQAVMGTQADQLDDLSRSNRLADAGTNTGEQVDVKGLDNEVDYDVMWSGGVYATGPFSDGGTGVGGGGTPGTISEQIPYRQIAGHSGPVMDRHTEYGASFNLQAFNIADTRVRADLTAMLVYDVREA